MQTRPLTSAFSSTQAPATTPAGSTATSSSLASQDVPAVLKPLSADQVILTGNTQRSDTPNSFALIEEDLANWDADNPFSDRHAQDDIETVAYSDSPFSSVLSNTGWSDDEADEDRPDTPLSRNSTAGTLQADASKRRRIEPSDALQSNQT
jgi:hypothetical protein